MSDPTRFAALRATYRNHWDAYQIIAHRNLATVQAGRRPTHDELKDEQRALTRVEVARDALLAAITEVGH